MDSETKKILDVVVENGYRLTSARLAIITALVNSAEHVTADDLADKVRQQAPHVGRMTVYRTLDLLCELGIVRPIYQGTGAAHYILMAKGSHHHLICNRCHGVIEFEECFAAMLIEEMAKRFDFHISSHLLEIHGLCENCYE
ncbi:MAG: transcriptional repressor [Ardenticatenaceae bacterium]|nr:transcriptional repressor [Ardenticatenaceae bacterium]